jgi:hypothetical protein
MIAFPLLLLIVPAIVKAAPRKAAVYYSDGKVLTGNISLTRGRKFKLNIPKGGKLKTSDMITGEDVRYGKVRRSGKSASMQSERRYARTGNLSRRPSMTRKQP